ASAQAQATPWFQNNGDELFLVQPDPPAAQLPDTTLPSVPGAYKPEVSVNGKSLGGGVITIAITGSAQFGGYAAPLTQDPNSINSLFPFFRPYNFNESSVTTNGTTNGGGIKVTAGSVTSTGYNFTANSANATGGSITMKVA